MLLHVVARKFDAWTAITTKRSGQSWRLVKILKQQRRADCWTSIVVSKESRFRVITWTGCQLGFLMRSVFMCVATFRVSNITIFSFKVLSWARIGIRTPALRREATWLFVSPKQTQLQVFWNRSQMQKTTKASTRAPFLEPAGYRREVCYRRKLHSYRFSIVKPLCQSLPWIVHKRLNAIYDLACMHLAI